MTLTLECDSFFRNFNLANNFWTMKMLELLYFTWIFPVIRPFRGYHYFLPCDLDLEVWPNFLENFNLSYKFWTVSVRALIFHMSIPCDKTFLWFHYFSINIRNLVLQMSIFCDIVDYHCDLDHKHILFSFLFRFAVITACNHLITCIWIIISRYIDCIRICMGLYTLRPIVLLLHLLHFEMNIHLM